MDNVHNQNNNNMMDLNGNGLRRPSVTMGIGHLLKSSLTRKSIGRNGNLYSPTTEFEVSLKELRYSISTQVNGQDLSNVSHDESIEVLQTAPEPIIIEVLRRNSTTNTNVSPPPTPQQHTSPSSSSSPPSSPTEDIIAANNNNNQQNIAAETMRSLSPDMVTASTQTDEGVEDDYAALLDPGIGMDLESAASFVRMYPFITAQTGTLSQPNCRQGVCFPPNHELSLTDMEMGNDDPVYDEPWDLIRLPFFPAVEYMDLEVLLERKSASEKLGLTLCYESHEDEGTAVFVSEIERESIAANDGRIREGDQILQINNTEVKSREEAIQLFAEECSQFALLLARQVEVDDGFIEERSSGTYEELQMAARYHPDLSQYLHSHPSHGESACSTDTASTSKSKQDSGLGRTDDSIKTEESSEQECLEGECPERCCHSNDSFTSNEAPENQHHHPHQRIHQLNHNKQVLSGFAFHHNNNTQTSHGDSSHIPKPPQSPSNKSDSNSYKSMSVSSNSSCHSSPLRQQSEEHIYDEPMLTPPNQSPTNTYQREIIELNREIENMRMECQKINESNKYELEKGIGCDSSNAKPILQSPRMVPRMGTRLDYIKQIQAIQQYGQMSSWIRQNQWVGGGVGPGSPSGNTNNNPASPYCVSNVPTETSHEHMLNNHNKSQQPPHCGGGLNNQQLIRGGCDTLDREVQYSNEKTDVYKDTSTTSAYNTGGESCRSTPLTLEVQPQYRDDGGCGYNMSMLSLAITTNGSHTPPSDHENNYPHQAKKKSKTLSHGGSSSSSRSKESSSNNSSSNKDGKSNKSNLTKSQSSQSVSHTTQTPEPPRPENLQNLYAQYAEVMYTNQANLHHTIMVQQKLFQQQIEKQARQQQREQQQQQRSSKHRKTTSASSKSHQQTGQSTNGMGTSPKQKSSSKSQLNTTKSSHNNSTVTDNDASLNNGAGGQATQGSSGSDNGNVQMEWVVKLRPDGTRYIARRPVRGKILKERARKLAQERCGMTTDDDAMSELKFGKYWKKEDRRKHLEKAKEHRKKKELLVKQKQLESLKENDDVHKEPNILDLSHRKMMKHKNKKVLDDFVTIQEMLVHGNRVDQQKTTNPLLSVTTV